MFIFFVGRPPLFQCLEPRNKTNYGGLAGGGHRDSFLASKVKQMDVDYGGRAGSGLVVAELNEQEFVVLSRSIIIIIAIDVLVHLQPGRS